MSVRYDELAPGHFAEWGIESPHPSRFIGFACRRDDRLVAIGCCYVDDEDVWRAVFSGREDFPHGIHRKALDLFRALTRAGVTEIRADLDTAIPKAREWLQRLGFTPADPAETEWILGLHPTGRRTVHAVPGGPRVRQSQRDHG